MKQLTLFDIPETLPEFTQEEKEIFETIINISPEDVSTISKEEPGPDFIPEPEWDGSFYLISGWWVQWSPILAVFHPRTGNFVTFHYDYSELKEVADKINELLE